MPLLPYHHHTVALALALGGATAFAPSGLNAALRSSVRVQSAAVDEPWFATAQASQTVAGIDDGAVAESSTTAPAKASGKQDFLEATPHHDSKTMPINT